MAHRHTHLNRGRPTLLSVFGLALFLAALLATPTALEAAPGPRDPREREIQKLENELAMLEGRLKEAMEFRARYRNLKADLAFQESLGRQDDDLLKKLLVYLNTPVSLFEAFLSSEATSAEKAEKTKGRYTPENTILWLRCRFGLPAIQEQAYYTVRVDIVDAQKGGRIFQSLGPYQRRVAKLMEKIPIPLTGIKVAPGTYQMRVSVEVGGATVNTLIPYQMGAGGIPPARPTAPPPRQGGGGVDTIGEF